MKKILSMAAVTCCMATVSFAATPDHSHFKIEAGLGIANEFNKVDYAGKRPDNSPVFGVGFGRQMNEMLSVDASVYRFQEFGFSHPVSTSTSTLNATQDISSTLLSFNMTGHLPKMSAFTPFVIAGAGVVANDSDDYRRGNAIVYGKMKYDVSWNIGAGVEIETGMPVDMVFSYRYFDLGQARSQGVGFNGTSVVSIAATKTDLQSHTMLAGLKYRF